MTRYVALVDDKPGSYVVTMPDLSGCTAANTGTHGARETLVSETCGQSRAPCLTRGDAGADCCSVPCRRVDW